MPNRNTHIFAGYVLGATDLLNLAEVPLDQVGILSEFFTGAISGMNSVSNPVVAQLDGFGNVEIGHTDGQQCILPNAAGVPRLVQEISLYTHGIPANSSGSDRIDVIYGQAINEDVDETSCSVETPASPTTFYTATLISGSTYTLTPVSAAVGGIEPGVVNFIARTATFGYQQGTPGGGQPSVPAGYVPIVAITVPASGGTITASDLQMIIPPFPLALLGALQKYLPFIIVTGADPTATVDSYPQLQAAINLAQALGIGWVIVPPGMYLCSSQLVVSASLRFSGSGSGITTILQGTATNSVFAATSISNLTIDNIGFSGFLGGTLGGIPILLTNVTNCSFDSVTISGFWTPVQLAGGSNYVWRNVEIYGCVAAGLELNNFGSNGKFTDCTFSRNGGNGVRITGEGPGSAGLRCTFSGCTIINNNKAAIGAAGLELDQYVAGVKVIGCDLGPGVNDPSDTQLYAVQLQGNNDHITLVSNEMRGNATAPINVLGTIGPHCEFSDNPGFNPQSSLPGFASPSMPVTNTPLQNPFGSDALVWFDPTGSTVASVVCGTITVTSPTEPFLIPVLKGQSITVQYSGGTPTWDWQVT